MCQVFTELESKFKLDPGSIMRVRSSPNLRTPLAAETTNEAGVFQNVPGMQEWVKTPKPAVLGYVLRLHINSALSEFVHSPDGSANDPLEMPAHAFALKCDLWLMMADRIPPQLKATEFLHGATVWAGLLRILAGHITIAGVDSSYVTPEFVRANLERLLQTIQADLDLAIDATGGGLLPLVSQPLYHIPAMFGYNVQISTVGGDPARNMISIGRPGDASHAERFAQTVRERFFPNAT